MFHPSTITISSSYEVSFDPTSGITTFTLDASQWDMNGTSWVTFNYVKQGIDLSGFNREI